MENRNDKSKNIIIIILIIMIVGLAGFICYEQFVVKKESEKPASIESKNEEKTKVEETETDITLSALIDDLSKKVSALSINGVKELLTEKSISVSTMSLLEEVDVNSNASKTIYNSKLTDKMKLLSVLSNLASLNKVSYSKNEVENKALYDSYDGQISSQEVEKEYLKLYGEKLDKHMTVDIQCPVYLYDSKNKVYFPVSACGGVSVNNFYLYKNRFTQKANEAYVYVNVGISNIEEKIIYDYNSDKVIEKNISNNFKINETNYTKFTEYKYTFTKDATGNYYFTKIEKVNK